MVNRYPGPCAACGLTVPPGAGTARKIGRSWSVRHSSDACMGGQVAPAPYRAANRSSYGRSSRYGGCGCEDFPCCGCGS